MTRRKARLGAEDCGHKVPKEGARVFKPAKDDKRPAAYFVGRSLTDGDQSLFKCRWPNSMRGSVQYGSPKREIIYTADLKRSSRPLPDDPYQKAEEIAAERKRAKREDAA